MAGAHNTTNSEDISTSSSLAYKLQRVNLFLDTFGRIILYILPLFILFQLIPAYILPLAIRVVKTATPYLLRILKKVVTIAASAFLLFAILPIMALAASVVAPRILASWRKGVSYSKRVFSYFSESKPAGRANST